MLEHATQSSGRPQHIFVDVSNFYRHDSGTGIQRVVREILRHLPSAVTSKANVVPIYATRYLPYRYCDQKRLPAIDGLATDVLPGAFVKPKKGDIFLGLDLSAHLLWRRGKQLGRWKKRGVEIVVVVYDLLPLTMPQYFNVGMCRNFEKWFAAIARYANRTISISGIVADEVSTLLRRHRSDCDGTGYIILGADPVPEAEASAANANLPLALDGKVITLSVGTVEPRKGYDVALAAFEEIWRRGNADKLAYVIVGKAGWKSEGLQNRLRQHEEYGKRLYWLTGIDDEALDVLYRRSVVLLAPSLGEGFGLPLVEAMLRYVPVLARNLPVFREVGGDAISYFNDDGQSALADSILQTLNAKNQSGADRVDVASWKEVTNSLAQQLLDRGYEFAAGNTSDHNRLSTD